MKTIAVLPLSKISSGDGYDYFSDGVTVDIISRLSRVKEIAVTSRTSVFQYKKSQKSVKEIGKELTADVILEGTFQQYTEHVRIFCRLIDARTGDVLWTETYDKELQKIFDIQNDITFKVLRVLNIEPNREVQDYLQSRATSNLTAYDYYLKARDFYYHLQPEDNEIAIQLFKTALSLDTGYVLAMSGLADAYSQRVAKFGYPQRWVDSALSISTKAIALDSRVAEAYKAQALAFSGKGWHVRSIETYLKAVELNPNYFTAVGNLGAEYSFIGKFDQAMVWFKRSIPLNRTFAFSYYAIGGTYTNLCKDQLAEEWFKKAIELQPDFQYVHCGCTLMYLRQGDYQHAIEEIQQVLSRSENDLEALTHAGWAYLLVKDYENAKKQFLRAISIDSMGLYWYGIGRSSTTALGYIYLKTGRESLAREMFQRSREADLRQLRQQSDWYTIRYDLAAINAVEGKNAEALQWLTKAKELGWRDYRMSLRDPFLERLHGEKEFTRIIDELIQLTKEMSKQVIEIEKRYE